MEIQPTDLVSVINRIKRAQGQLAGVLRMIDEEREFESVLNQLKAVSSALERASFALISTEWRRALGSDGGLTDEGIDRLEKLFLSLA